MTHPTIEPKIIPVISKQMVAMTCELAAEIWREHYTPIIGPAQVAYMLESFQSPDAIAQQIDNEGFSYYLLTNDEHAHPIGYFALQQRNSTIFISKFYLLKSSRNRGYGWKMLRFMEQVAREKKCDRLTLTVNRHNLDTLKAYMRMGFQRTGELLQDIGNGYVMDDYLYEKSVITLDIIYQDDYFVAINKPSGLLVHKSMIDKSETEFAIQIVRDQIGQYVYPLHRLDKPTSGVLLFAFDRDTAKIMGEQFERGDVQKSYIAVVRGYIDEAGHIDYPLKEVLDKMTDSKAREDKEAQEAVTDFHRLGTVELPYPVSRYPQARYSLVRLSPKTGRKHQLRRHMKHIMHPIVGDTKYGRTEHNRLFREKFDSHRLLLHASELSFHHPYTQQKITLKAPLDDTMQTLFSRIGFPLP